MSRIYGSGGNLNQLKQWGGRDDAAMTMSCFLEPGQEELAGKACQSRKYLYNKG